MRRTAFKLCFQFPLVPLRNGVIHTVGSVLLPFDARAVRVDPFKPRVESAYGFSRKI